MKHTIKIICSLLILVLFSCDKKDSESSNRQNETPKALQEETLIPKRMKSRETDLVNELYYELVDKSKELKLLEDEIENFNPNDSLNKFYSYDTKSEDYYMSSKYLTNKIDDSITKNKIVALLKKSNDKYTAKSNEVRQIIEEIGDKRSSIKDYHNVLKIVLTLPLIEKYQTDNLPTNNKYQSIIKKQDSIIEKTKKLTPKY